MAGRLIKLLDRVDFSFDLTANRSQDIVVAKAIFVPDWKQAVLTGLLHAKNGGTAQAYLKLQNTFLTESDPTVAFNASSDLVSLTVAYLDTAPKLYVGEVTTGIGAYVRVIIQHAQGTGPGACSYTLSLFLLGRDT